jgi:hypothetical protein
MQKLRRVVQKVRPAPHICVSSCHRCHCPDIHDPDDNFLRRRRGVRLFFSFALNSNPKPRGKKKEERERESQTTEASEESSHAPQCTLNPNPKTRGIGEEQRTEREGGERI